MQLSSRVFRRRSPSQIEGLGERWYQFFWMKWMFHICILSHASFHVRMCSSYFIVVDNKIQPSVKKLAGGKNCWIHLPFPLCGSNISPPVKWLLHHFVFNRQSQTRGRFLLIWPTLAKNFPMSLSVYLISNFRNLDVEKQEHPLELTPGAGIQWQWQQF